MKKSRKAEKSSSSKKSGEEIVNSPVLRNLFESLPLPVFYKDICGIYIACNQKFGKLSGTNPADIIGKTSGEIFPSDIAEIYDREDMTALKNQEAQTYEAVLASADGTKHTYIFHKKPLDNRSEMSCGLIGSIFDITERKEFEAHLRKDEERYRRIFENIQDVYYEVNMEGTIMEISPSIEKYSLFKRETLIGQSIYDFYADKNEREIFLQTIRQNGYVHDFEIKLLNHENTLRTCSINAAILPADKEHPPLIVGSLRDISERKHSEEILRQREEELSIKSKNLEEMNTALKVLLRQREEDRRENEENVLTNVKASIIPYIDKFKEQPLTGHQKTCLGMLEAKINEIVSPFIHSMRQAGYDLTPQEMRVTDFVKNGNTTKEIADALGISMKTVDYHRENIRRKLGIKNRQTSLRSYLLKFL